MPSLLVVCGDHGMSNYGSHGGSSDSETLIPFVFAFVGNSTFQPHDDSSDDIVPQSSLAPTLSALLGLPIPVNSLGQLLSAFFVNLDERRRLYLSYANAHQMVRLMNASSVDDFNSDVYATFESAVELHADLVASGDFETERSKRATSLYDAVTRGTSQKLTASILNQDLYLMIVAAILLWQHARSRERKTKGVSAPARTSCSLASCWRFRTTASAASRTVGCATRTRST